MCSDKKKALVICKESYTYPMNYIKDELKGRGYEVEAFFVHYTETILEDHSYRSFRERDSDAVIYTFNSAIKLFWDNYKNAEQFLDKQYLKYVEDTYCGDLPFGILLMSSQLFSTPYHYRFYLKDL
ncbi:MAG: hypothetical protein Q8O64_03335, partial [Sideroxyarcus sp.]|nr:hypothetical protein [Sideroxyarcus sp.]